MIKEQVGTVSPQEWLARPKVRRRRQVVLPPLQGSATLARNELVASAFAWFLRASVLSPK